MDEHEGEEARGKISRYRDAERMGSSGMCVNRRTDQELETGSYWYTQYHPTKSISLYESNNHFGGTEGGNPLQLSDATCRMSCE